MRSCHVVVVVAVLSSIAPVGFAFDSPRPLVSGLGSPAAVCVGPQGLLYVSETGALNKDGDGKISVIRDGQPHTFADGLNDPMGIVFFRDALYVVDKTKVVRIDPTGRTADYMTAKDFPAPPQSLRHVVVDAPNGIFLISDAGDEHGNGGAIYRIDVRLNTINTVANKASTPELRSPQGIVFDGESFALVADAGAQAILRVKLNDGAAQAIATKIDGIQGLTWDHFGRLYFSSATTGRVFGIPRPGEQSVVIASGSPAAEEISLDASGQRLIVTSRQSGALATVSKTIPGWEVDEAPLPVDIKLAFPNLRWTGWDDGSESGKITSLRPILLTHAGDGSNRVFVPTQQGIIHVFDNNDLMTTNTKIFLDLTDRVRFNDKENEEGFLGLAFHPNYAKNGEFFVFYTDAKEQGVNVVSRFRVKRDDTDAADPASEEQLVRIEKPYWNHDGGTVAFGPDGYLYIAHGDGGAGGDPHGNGQNLAKLLGKVLRIDVDHKANGRNYAIPADNPFAKQTGAAPEVWAYGLRNVWRMAFDRKTGNLWAGEVGAKSVRGDRFAPRWRKLWLESARRIAPVR